MMNTLKVARQIIQEHFAAKEQKPSQTSIKPPVNRRRYYFFDAKPENAIKFTALKEILDSTSPEKNATIEKLKSGNSGRYFADYFSWKKIAVVSNEFSPDGKTVRVYEAQLSPIGAKIPGSENVTPAEGALPVDEIETRLLLFEDKRGNSNVINIDQSDESNFIDTDPPNNLAKILLSNAIPAGNNLKYQDFIKKFDEYRIWVPNLNQLLLPDMQTPKNDDVAGGHYPGGEAAFNKYIKPHVEPSPGVDQPESPSLKEKIEEKGTESPYRPVDRSTEPVKGDIIDRGTSKTAQSGDYSSKPYSGGTDVLQRLVKDQRKHMNIRKTARKLAAAYLDKISQYQTVKSPAQTTTTVTKSDQPKIPISNNPAKNEQSAKLLSDLAKKQKDLKKEISETQQEIQKAQKSVGQI